MAVIIEVYVDRNKAQRGTRLRDLHSCVPIKNRGQSSYYLGCRITQDRTVKTLKLDQCQKVQAGIVCFGITMTSAIPARSWGGDYCRRHLVPKTMMKLKNATDSFSGSRRGSHVGNDSDAVRRLIRRASARQIHRNSGARTLEGRQDGTKCTGIYFGERNRRGTKLSA